VVADGELRLKNVESLLDKDEQFTDFSVSALFKVVVQRAAIHRVWNRSKGGGRLQICAVFDKSTNYSM